MSRLLLLASALLFSAVILADEPVKELGEVRNQIDKLSETLTADKQSKEAL